MARERKRRAIFEIRGRRSVSDHSNGPLYHRLQHRPRPGFRHGHRGAAHFQWRCGPREPPVPRCGHRNYDGAVTLFIDGISESSTMEDLKTLFQEKGKLLDVYISKKKRPNRKQRFGFVRFEGVREARKAIMNINGKKLKGEKLFVSMAKYSKGGRPVAAQNYSNFQNRPQTRWIIFPAYRDSRKYVEVVKGKRTEANNTQQNEEGTPVVISPQIHQIEEETDEGTKSAQPPLVRLVLECRVEELEVD
ncbi:unnamed protein product [Amaranthus hypochondriacus]